MRGLKNTEKASYTDQINAYKQKQAQKINPFSIPILEHNDVDYFYDQRRRRRLNIKEAYAKEASKGSNKALLFTLAWFAAFIFIRVSNTPFSHVSFLQYWLGVSIPCFILVKHLYPKPDTLPSDWLDEPDEGTVASIGTPSDVDQFLDQWSKTKATMDQVFDISEDDRKQSFTKWLTLDEQYEYLKRIDGALLNQHEQWFNALGPSFVRDVFHERYTTEGLRREMIAKHLHKPIPVSTDYKVEALIEKVKDNGLDPFEWLIEYRKTIYPYVSIAHECLNGIRHARRRVEQGINGEKALEETLALYDDRFRVLTNVRIVENGISAESDAIIVSRHGVFTIEAKNFSEKGQYGLHIAKDGKWSKIEGGAQKPMDDVVEQNNRHILAKQNLLNRELKQQGKLEKDDYLDVEGIITITNNVVDIQNESDFPILRLSHLYNHMRKHPVIYSEEQVNAMVDIIKNNMQPPQRFPLPDYEKLLLYHQKPVHDSIDTIAVPFGELFGLDADEYVKGTIEFIPDPDNVYLGMRGHEHLQPKD